MPVLSRHILKLSLTKKVGRPEPGLSFYLRKSEHLTVLDLVDNMRLQNDYEAYLKALILRHEKNYKGSLEMIANDRNKALVPFKTKLYYNLKRFDDITQIANSGYDVLGELSSDQQEILLRNLLKENEYQLIEKMIEKTGKNKSGLEELYHQEKDDLFYQYSWSNYRENILGNVDRDSTLEEIKTAIEKISFDYLVLIDGDLGNTSNEVIKIITPAINKEADIVIAKFRRPKVKGGFGLVKSLANKGVLFYTGKEIKSTLSGQRVYSRKVIDSINYIPNRFGIEVAMTVEALRKGFTVMEVDVDMEHRETGRNLKGFIHRGRQFMNVLITLIILFFRR